jgi:hypothetical protein
MQIREIIIGGQASYEIVEEIHHATGTKFRVIVSLGTDSDPEDVRRRRQSDLLGLGRSLERLIPLRDADPGIARKCNSMANRIDRERNKIAQLTSAIEQMAAPPSVASQSNPGDGLLPRGNVKRLRLVPGNPSDEANKYRVD